jgi:hypothetical protein
LITGARVGDHFRVAVGKSAISLTFASIKALIDLTIARANGHSGFARMEKMTIRRLRAAVDKQLGDGVGKALIETGSGEEYRLAIPKSKLRARVRLTACFFELAGIGVISEVDSELMGRICGRCSRKLAEGLLDGY